MLFAGLAALPAVVLALALLWTGEVPLAWRALGTMVVLGGLGGGLVLLRHRVNRPLQTIANQLAAIRVGDFSQRARTYQPQDDLALLFAEANAVAAAMRAERLGAIEANGLLRAVTAGIDAALFTFDDLGALVLVNRGGERLLDAPAVRLVGRRADELGLAGCLAGPSPRVLDVRGASGNRWEMRRSTFYQDGRPHTLLLLTDVRLALQAEEREAWRRLVRVLSHEINNSLAPIRSVAGSLRALVEHGPRSTEDEDDLRAGLEVIEQRAASLGRFIAAYARLARLPEPVRRPMRVADWVQRAAALELRRPVTVQAGDQGMIDGDADQLDQLLINLVRNAVDAVGGTAGTVTVAWHLRREDLEVIVEDEGPGLVATGNLFVPFYTTKPGGSGIGLALSRRIAEAHGGTLELVNRDDRSGCRAIVRLPRAEGAPVPAGAFRSGAHHASVPPDAARVPHTTNEAAPPRQDRAAGRDRRAA